MNRLPASAIRSIPVSTAPSRHQARVRDGLTKVVVEDREGAAGGRVVDPAAGGVEYRLDASDVDRPEQPAGLSLAHRVPQIQLQRQHRGELPCRWRVSQRRGHDLVAEPQHNAHGSAEAEGGVTTVLVVAVDATVVSMPAAGLPVEQPASTMNSKAAANAACPAAG